MDRSKLIRLSSNDSYLRYMYISAIQSAAWEEWIKDCTNNTVFYEGGEGQWTEAELESLKAKGGYTLTMDLTRKAINSIVGQLTANKPTLKCIPVNSDDVVKAEIYNMLLDQVWRDSDGLEKLRTLLTNAYKTNIAYAVVLPYKNRVRWDYLTYEQVLVDPGSKDAMFRDAENIWIKKWVRVERVKAMYGVESFNTAFPADWWTIDNNASRQLQLFDRTRRYVLVYEGYKKVFIPDAKGVLKARIEKEVLLGYEYVYRDILPEAITDYPIIPVYSSVSANPLKYSELHYMKDGQRFINKMYNVAIQNAQVMGSPKIAIHTTDIPNEDIESFENNFSKPGAVIELNPGAEVPAIIQGQPLPSAMFELYQDATKYMFNIYSTLLLDNQGSSEANKSVSLYEQREAAMDSLRVLVGIYESMTKQLGRCILQACKAYMSNDEIVRITEARKKLDLVEIDMRNGLDVNNPEVVKQWIANVQKKGIQQSEIDEYLANAKSNRAFVDAVFDIINNIDDLQYDVDIVQNSYAPTYQANKFNIALNLAQQGIVDPETILELAPIENKDKIIQRMSTIKQQNNMIEQLNKQLEDVSKELDKRENQIKDLMLKGIQTEEKVKQDYLYKDGRLKEQGRKMQDMLASRQKSMNLDYQIKNFMLELEKNKDQVKDLTYEDIVSNLNITE